MWVCPAAAAWGPSRRPTAVDVVWRLTRRFSAGRRRARGVGRVCGAMSAARPPARALRPQASAGFVIQRLQLLGRRDAREPRFLHPALGNEGGELWLQCWLQRGRWRRTLGGLRFDECVSGRDTSSDDAEQGVGGWPVKSRHRMVQHELRTSGAACRTDPRGNCAGRPVAAAFKFPGLDRTPDDVQPKPRTPVSIVTTTHKDYSPETKSAASSAASSPTTSAKPASAAASPAQSLLTAMTFDQ